MRTVAMTGLVALLGGLLAGPVAVDLPQIKGRGVLRVLVARQNGGVASQSPFFATEPGQASGFDREVLERVAKANGLRLESVVVAGYDALIPDLMADKGDVIAGSFTITEGRHKQIEFTREVLPTRTIVVTRKP